MEAPSGSYLCYGDLIFLEALPDNDSSNMHHLHHVVGNGLVGLESYESSTLRLSTINSVNHAGKGTTSIKQQTNESVLQFTKKRYLSVNPLWIDRDTIQSPTSNSSSISGDGSSSSGANKKSNNTVQTSVSTNTAVSYQNQIFQIPTDCFSANIFQIAYGVGFEAPGEPLHYGSQIKLILVSTEEFIRSNGQNDAVELVSKQDQERNSKECNFKIKSSHNVRSEGDYVYFRDLLHFVDFIGRNLYSAGSNHLKLSNQYKQKSGFRMLPYLSYRDVAEKTLKGGDIFQIYHKVEHCFLMAGTSNNRFDPSASKPQNPPAGGNYEQAIKLFALPQDKTTIETCSTLWQIETIPFKNDAIDWKLPGIIVQGRQFYLRHLLSGKYLSVSSNLANGKNEKITLVDRPDEDCRFEFRLNMISPISAGNANDSDPLEGSRIPCDNDVRIFHPKTKKHLKFAGKKSKESGSTFVLSGSYYDKDVYRIHPAPPDVIEMIFSGKKIRHGMEGMLKRMDSPQTTAVNRTDMFQKLTILLESLRESGGFLDPERSNRYGYMTANDLGMVFLIFRLAERAFSPLIKPPENEGGNKTVVSRDISHFKAEMELAKVVYHTLSLILTRNSDAVYSVLKCGGVKIMIQHLVALSLLSDQMEWTPPLLEFIEAVHYEELQNDIPIDTMGSEEVAILLEVVYRQVIKEVTANEYVYTILSRLCKPHSGTMSASYEKVNRRMQMIVAKHLLGSPYGEDGNSPRNSVFLYRTVLESAEESETNFPKLYIATSIYGQFKPCATKDTAVSPIRPKSIPKSSVDEDQWRRAMHLKSEIWNPTSRTMTWDSEIRQQAMDSIPDFPELERTINSLLESIRWKELNKLEEGELRFYCASLDLLASISAGRNGWTQRLVRQVLPVDHILHVMENIRGDDSGVNHVHEDRSVHRTYLLPIKTKMIEVLHYCYVDSAFLPPIPKSGKSSFLEFDQQDSMTLTDWDDIFYRECSVKLFGIFSQEDCDIFSLPDDMDMHELKLYVEAFNKNCIKFGKRSPIWREMMRAVESGNVTKLRNIIGAMNESIKKDLAQRNVHSLEQRAVLMRVVKQFANEEAPSLWTDHIRSTVSELTLKKDSSVIFRPMEDSSELLRHESSTLKGVDELNRDDAEIVEGVTRSVQYMETMLALIQALMLRRFFEPENMCNPVLTKPGTKIMKGVVRNATIDDDYFYPHPPNSLFTFDYIQTAVDQKLKVINIKDDDTFSHQSYNTTVSVKEKTKLFRKIRARSTVVKAPVGDMLHIRGIMKCMLNIISIQPERAIYKKFRFQDDEKLIDEFYLKFFGYSQDDYGLLQGIMNITLLACKILGTSLDLLHSVTVQELKDLFYPIFDAMIELKYQHDLDEKAQNPNGGDKEQAVVPAAVAQFGLKKTAAHFFASKLKAKFRNMNLTEEDNKQFRAKTWGELYTRVARNPDMIWNVPHLFLEESLKSYLEVIYYNDPQLRAEVMSLIYRVNARRAELSEYIMKEFLIDYKAISPMVLFLNRGKFLLSQILERFDQYFFPEEDLLSLDPVLMMKALGHDGTPIKKKNKRKHKNRKQWEADEIITVDEVRKRARAYRTRKLMLSVLQLKKLLLRYNENDHMQIGLINFCCLEEFLPEKGEIKKTADTSHPPQTHEDLMETTLAKPANFDDETLGGPIDIATKFFKIVERAKTVSDRVKRKPDFSSHDEDFSETSKLFANFKHQRVLVEFGFHHIVISYMNRNAQHLLRGDVSANEPDEEVKEMDLFASQNQKNDDTDEEDADEEEEEANHEPTQSNNQEPQESNQDPANGNNQDVSQSATEEKKIPVSGESLPNDDLLNDGMGEDSSNFEFPIYLEIFRHLTIFLQNIIRENKDLTKIIDKEFVATLILIRSILPETMDLLSMLIKLDAKIVQFITDAEFVELLSDIRIAATSPAMVVIAGKVQVERPLTSTETKVLTNMNRTLTLLQNIIFSDPKLSPYRIQRFIDLLRAPLAVTTAVNPTATTNVVGGAPPVVSKDGNNTLLYHRILQMGLEFELSENGGIQHGIKFQVNFTCFKYQLETNRPTFSRMPRDILNDKPLSDIMYMRLKTALQRWALLPIESNFRAHLESISFIATMTKSNGALQKLMKGFFPSCLEVLKILMIDKTEVKFPYLKLLEGIWFERMVEHNTIVPSDMMLKSKCKPYFKALFYSFCQDIRLYLYLVHDKSIDRSTWRSNDSLGMLPQQFKLLEKYIKFGILPFMIATLRSNLCEALDAIADPPEDHDGGNKKQKRNGSNPAVLHQLGSNVPSTPMKSSQVFSSMEPETGLFSASGDGDPVLPRNSSHQSLIDGGGHHREPEKPKEPNRMAETIRSLTTEVMELICEIIDCNSEMLLPKNQDDGVAMKQLFSKLLDDLTPLVATANAGPSGLVSAGPFTFKKLLASSTSNMNIQLSTPKVGVNELTLTILKRTIKRIDGHISSVKRAQMSALFAWNNPAVSSHLFFREDLKKLRKHCLLEFIPEVDRFAITNGYIGLDHIVKTPCAQRIYANDKEFIIPTHLAFDISLVASSFGLSKFDIIANPLNCESFRYTQKVISKIIVAHAHLDYEERFDEVVAAIEQIPNNQERELIDLYRAYAAEWEDVDVKVFKDASGTEDVDGDDLKKQNKANEIRAPDVAVDNGEIEVVNEEGCCSGCGKSKQSCCAPSAVSCFSCCGKDESSAAQQRRQKTQLSFAAYHFDRWSERQGMLFSLFFEHFTYCLASFQRGLGLEKVSAKSSEIIKCNLYWGMLFTRGMLRSRVADLYDLYADQTETQLAQLAVEKGRLSLIQDVFREFGAVNVVVQQLSVSETSLHQSLTDKDLKLLHKMAIDLGSALNENGNTDLQDATIDAIQFEYKRSLSTGKNVHFVSVIRSLFQGFSHRMSDFQSVDASITADIVRLLRFLSLLCEGHNKKAQLYFGTHKIVSEVANFVADMTKILSTEFEAAMFTEEELPLKLRPTVLGAKRSLVRWINPWPGTLPMENADSQQKSEEGGTTADKDSKTQLNGSNAGKKGKCKFLPLEKLALLVEVVTAGLEALSEFCQGPLPEVQLVIARGGSTKEFNTFFEFFGAVQLCQKYHANSSQRVEGRVFRDNVQFQTTHQTLLNMAPHGSYWYGNDPIALMILLDALAKTPISGGNQDENSALFQKIEGKNSWKEWLCGGSSPTFADDNFAARYSTIEANKMDISVPSAWVEEKANYIEYMKVKDKVAESFDGNYFARIAKFESELAALESSCVKLAASLLEGSSNDLEIPTIVLHHIGKECLVANMANYWARFKSYDPAIPGMDDQDCFEREMAYAYYALTMRFCDIHANAATEDAEDEEGTLQDLVDAWIESSKLRIDDDIARIEVRNNSDGFPVVAYFPVPSLIKRYWTRGDIIELRDNILFPTKAGGRDSAEEKVKSFLRDGSILITTLRHLESLDEMIATKSIFLYFMVEVAHKFNSWSYVTFVLTITINILLIGSVVDVPTSEGAPGQSYTISGQLYQALVPLIAMAHLGSTCLTVYSFSVMYGWLYLKMGWRDNPANEFSYRGYMPSRIVRTLNRLGLFGVGRAELVGNSITVNVWTLTASLFHIFEHHDCIYYIALITFSCLGNLSSPLFFACCLMEILRLSKLMQYVTKAFTANIDQVIATLLLAAIILYLFTTLAFSDGTLHNKYALDSKGENGCDSLESCFRLHLDYGVLQPVMWIYDGHIETMQGELFNFGYTFIMQIVIPGLISGIIIDTFSEMRGDKQAVEEDVMNTCFICNIDREDFETSNIPFTHHIKNDHNMWKYVWFMIYLDEKDHTEFDGIEQYCYDVIEKRDFSTRWLPLKMARALSKMRDKYDLFTIYNKITTLQTSLQKLGIDIKGDLAQQEKNLFEAIRNMNNGGGGGGGGASGGKSKGGRSK